MKQIFFLIFLFISCTVLGQTAKQYIGTPDNTVQVRNALDILGYMKLPRKDTLNNVSRTIAGSVTVRPQDGKAYLSDGTSWAILGSGPSSVNSANGFSGTFTNGVLNLQTTASGLLKGAGNSILPAVAGTDFVLPTGNVATASALQNSITINGVSFNGSANITVPAASSTLTGTSLSATIVSSSLQSVGTLGSLTVINPIAGSITGNSGTATKLATTHLFNGQPFDGTQDFV